MTLNRQSEEEEEVLSEIAEMSEAECIELVADILFELAVHEGNDGSGA